MGVEEIVIITVKLNQYQRSLVSITLSHCNVQKYQLKCDNIFSRIRPDQKTVALIRAAQYGQINSIWFQVVEYYSATNNSSKS